MEKHILPMRKGCELVGRMLPNAFNVLEHATLPQGCWDFYDWCAKNGLDMKDWVRRTDALRVPELSFSENLWGALWKLECSRYHQGLPCPSSSPPEGYVEYLEEFTNDV